MDILVLDTSLKAVSILDKYESLIWTDRYSKCGDFEVYVKASDDILNTLQSGYYLWNSESEHAMIVEGCHIEFNSEDGNYMVFTGRSLESIIERRIVWTQTVLSGNLQNGIKQLLDDNIISPLIPERKISNFIFEASDDPIITALTINAQFTGTNLYDTINKICDANDIGFKVTLSDTNQFVFKLYSGVDRSYSQIQNPYVIFSPKFDNLISGNYINNIQPMKNVTLVAGEGEGSSRKTTTVGSGEALSRREMYTDARDISQTVDGVLLPDSDYLAQLSQRGIEDLSQNTINESFDGKVDTNILFKYGEDFYMGDIVQLVSEYGIDGKARVTEFIRSQSTRGMDSYPTFTMIN